MERKQKDRLNWFINFINLDLDGLPTAEKSKIAAETDPMLFSSNPKLTEFLENPEMVEPLHNRLEIFFKDMMEKIGLALSNPRRWKSAKKLIDSLIFSEIEMKKTIGVSINAEKIEKKLEINKEIQNQFRSKGLETATIKVGTTRISNSGDAFLTEFMNSLDGVPLGAFKKCKECENWYIHFSRRAKAFCTNNCASRHGARRRRQKKKQETPDIYAQSLKKDAERAHTSYRKKVKKKTPRAQPVRRPIKHKD
jgi:hypothetical protein